MLEQGLTQEALEATIAEFKRFLSDDSKDLYTRLNEARDWFNANHEGFELYLEDEWDVYKEGETWFDYNLRSLVTKDELPPLASDVYTNHRDEGGVWHLGEYQSSHLRGFTAWDTLRHFLKTHRVQNDS